MTRLFTLALLAAAVVLPSSAAAVERAPGDGTLSVKQGRGRIDLKLHGAVIGKLASGRVVIRDPDPFDGNGPQVWGCDRGSKDLSSTTSDPDDVVKVCSGSDLRFRAVGGLYSVSLRGSGIFLSVVGRGRVVLDGRGEDGTRDGVFSLNGDAYESLPDFPTPYSLGATPFG